MKKKHVSLSPRSAAILCVGTERISRFNNLNFATKSKFILPVVGVSYSGYDDPFRRETSFKPY